MNTPNRAQYQDVLFSFLAFAFLLPVTAQYLAAFCCVLFLASRARWRLVWGPGDTRPEICRQFTRVLRPMHLGVALYVASLVLAALLAMLLSPYHPSIRDTSRVLSHLILKQGLLWFLLSTTVAAALADGWAPARVTRSWILLASLYLIYVMVQRHTGIDWVHGFSARLPANRFAYDVWRPSGWMGHPLTLAYNASLALLVMAVVALPPTPAPQRLGRWCFSVILPAFIVLLTASRWPVLALALIGLGFSLPHLRRWRWWILGLGIAFAAIIFFEGTLLQRGVEIFTTNRPLVERFPRVAFWHVHWNMFLDNPLTGVGIASADSALVDYYAAAGYNSLIEKYSAHQIILQTLADSGLIGMLGLIGLWIGLGRSAREARREHLPTSASRGLWALLLASILFGLMQNNLRDTEFLYALWLGAAFVVAHGLRPDAT
jgi:O-antigen ligase